MDNIEINIVYLFKEKLPGVYVWYFLLPIQYRLKRKSIQDFGSIF